MWVYDLLKEAKISGNFTAQGSDIKEINEALQTASKRGTVKVGFPEYVGVVKNFLVVIEDKADTSKHANFNENEIISEDIASICDYAVNGALFYGKHLAKNTIVSFTDKSQNNEYALLFLKQMIVQQKSKYQYGYKFNGKRMARQKNNSPFKK